VALTANSRLLNRKTRKGEVDCPIKTKAPGNAMQKRSRTCARHFSKDGTVHSRQLPSFYQ